MAKGSRLLILLLAPSLAAAHEDLEEQIADATKCIQRDPGNAGLHLKRGELHRLHRDWKAALADYARAQELAPDLAVVDLARGKMWLDAGDPKAAREEIDRFLAKNPTHADALWHRGRALVRLGERLAAAKEYGRALALMAEPNPDIYLERADALAAEGGKYLEEALSGLEEGMVKLGRIPTLQLRAIELEVTMQRYDDALARLEESIRQSPRKERWLARRGEILRKAGRPDEARKAFAAALASVEALPHRLRSTKATLELERNIRAALEVADDQH